MALGGWTPSHDPSTACTQKRPACCIQGRRRRHRRLRIYGWQHGPHCKPESKIKYIKTIKNKYKLCTSPLSTSYLQDKKQGISCHVHLKNRNGLARQSFVFWGQGIFSGASKFPWLASQENTSLAAPQTKGIERITDSCSSMR